MDAMYLEASNLHRGLSKSLFISILPHKSAWVVAQSTSMVDPADFQKVARSFSDGATFDRLGRPGGTGLDISRPLTILRSFCFRSEADLEIHCHNVA